MTVCNMVNVSSLYEYLLEESLYLFTGTLCRGNQTMQLNHIDKGKQA